MIACRSLNNGLGRISTSKKAPRIVFVHGAFLNKGVWNKLLELSNQFAEAEAIDLIGHGDRKDEIDPEFPVTFEDYTKDVLNAAKKGPCIIVAHSLGALVAMAAVTSKYGCRENILELVCISSSGPKGVLLPWSATWRMLVTPQYMWAMSTGRRFRLKNSHVRRFMLNKTVPLRQNDKLAGMESESGMVIRQLVFGVEIFSRIQNMHLYALHDDKMATAKMQRKIVKMNGGVKYLQSISDVDHLGLDARELIDPLIYNLSQLVNKHR